MSKASILQTFDPNAGLPGIVHDYSTGETYTFNANDNEPINKKQKISEPVLDVSVDSENNISKNLSENVSRKNDEILNPKIEVELQVENSPLRTVTRFHQIFTTDDEKYLIFIFDRRAVNYPRTYIDSSSTPLAVKVVGVNKIFVLDLNNIIQFSLNHLDITITTISDIFSA